MNRALYFCILAAYSIGCGGSQTKSESATTTSKIDGQQAAPSKMIAPKPLTQSEMDQILADARTLIENGDFRSAEDTLEKALLSDVQGDFLFHARYNLGVLC